MGHLEVEVGDLLRGRGLDGAVEDGVNDAAGVLDGDALAGAVPAGVDQIGLGAAGLHALDQLLSVLGGMQLEEGLPKQAEKVGVGSVMPRSVPASLAVKPERK